ncbi:N-acetyllactosaminide beta-1,3-N-acetylglucosaminyltransferase 3 [Falco biarmicus]|uniref:N-acetyllactosaminide beta-1,3-N-acetylglucosaminyltransferase 3 n=1 Tax=Falco biarmicus TaxID=345155 RepID=UPI0024BCFF19|nr:N-acetyllactosaminide beta-1,3-N-acetylglucosaminyltransferase 3 [Falco biarmicus]
MLCPGMGHLSVLDARGFAASSGAKPTPHLLQSMSLWCHRLELWGLVTVGLLGLCYLLCYNDQLWSSMAPQHSTPPSPQVTPSLPPLRVLPSPAPCMANTSVHNISGFTKLPGHVQDFMRYQHCRSFPVLLSIPGKCGGPQGSSSIFLLLAIKSSPVNYERREVIRKTWGQERTFEGAFIRRVFLVGVAPRARDAKKLNQLLRLEQREHRDVLQWDFRDTFFNLTLKQVLFHTWLVEHCPGVRFIFNGDDDVFVNTDNVVRFAMATQGAQEQHLMVGQLFVNNSPVRLQRSKYFVPMQLLASRRYPPYCGGSGMLMSGFTARVISRESQDIRLFPIDDVYLGMCLEKAGLLPASHAGIRTMGVGVQANEDSFDPCYYRELMLVHRFVPYEVAVMWQAIHEPQLLCGRRVSIF